VWLFSKKPLIRVHFHIILAPCNRPLKKAHLLCRHRREVIAAYRKSTPHDPLLDFAHLDLFERPEKAGFFRNLSGGVKKMPRMIEGNLSAKGLKVAIVVGRFNDFISERLLEGALDTLLRSGAADSDIDVVKVPGAFEIPVAAKSLAKGGGYDAILCLGCVIRGATPHFEYVAGEAAKGVARVSLDFDTPVSFGIITAENLEQAIERAGTKSGNKGRDAALTAIEMANLLKTLGKKK